MDGPVNKELILHMYHTILSQSLKDMYAYWFDEYEELISNVLSETEIAALDRMLLSKTTEILLQQGYPVIFLYKDKQEE